MSTTETILATAKRTLLSESKSIENLVNYLDEDFAKSVTEIFNTKGRLVVTGIGKSALIAQKIVATLNSTGIFATASSTLLSSLQENKATATRANNNFFI